MVASARDCYENCIEFSLLYENYAIINTWDYTVGTLTANFFLLDTFSKRENVIKNLHSKKKSL